MHSGHKKHNMADKMLAKHAETKLKNSTGSTHSYALCEKKRGSDDIYLYRLHLTGYFAIITVKWQSQFTTRDHGGLEKWYVDLISLHI